MQTMKVTCGNCAGIGIKINWKDIGNHTLQKEEVQCENCNGKGYTEHALFSVEEGKAILKHCGLDTY